MRRIESVSLTLILFSFLDKLCKNQCDVETPDVAPRSACCLILSNVDMEISSPSTPAPQLMSERMKGATSELQTRPDPQRKFTMQTECIESDEIFLDLLADVFSLKKMYYRGKQNQTKKNLRRKSFQSSFV